MAISEKSSDEILKELFGLCQQKRALESDGESGQGSSSEDGDSASSILKRHKRKKRKKKHRKGKKRRRSVSADGQESENRSVKKKKKSRKECNDEEPNDSQCKKIELKIKREKDDKAPNIDRKPIVCDKVMSNENTSQNYMDTKTGKSLTLDDVFSTLGIVTEGPSLLKIKEEKVDRASETVKVKQEKDDLSTATEVPFRVEPAKPKEDTKLEVPNKLKKSSIADVFDDSGSTNDAEKQKTGPKKLIIKNLKNSTVYEATMKEIEELERLRAEKYEEGEITSSSVSSEDGSAEEEIVEKDGISLGDKDHPHKHKKRSKSRGRSGSKHRSRCHKRKHHRRKSEHREHKSREKHRSLDRGRHKSKTSRSHSRHHRYPRRGRSPSAESRGSSVHRSHDSRSRKRERSREIRSGLRNRIKSKERCSNSTEKIDKQKLLEIARKNAISLLQQGAMPASVIASKDKFASIKAGGKTVDELTDFCKQLAKKDAEGHDSISSESEIDSGDDKGKPFHHPFQLKERPSNIVMNIRNSVPLPTKTAQEKTLELSKQLSLQYPVSSGQQHRTTENVWVPVEKPPETAVVSQSSKVVHTHISDSNVSLAYPGVPVASCPMPPALPPALTNSLMPSSNGMGIDISSIVAQRLEAIRRLSENPRDPVGTNLIQTADSKMTVWAESKVQPGLFTGSTGVKPLSVAELSSGFKAWPKKNQFTAAKPVYSDKGEALMKKMGWQPGEGLGKYKQGPSMPCEISMKTDRKGLAEQSVNRSCKQRNVPPKVIEISQNKHPVSLLNEFCSRKKIGVPQYDCEEKEGTGRRKLFLFSVTVEGVKYTPKMPSTNKKQSKVEAATTCLQTLGMLPIVPATA